MSLLMRLGPVGTGRSAAIVAGLIAAGIGATATASRAGERAVAPLVRMAAVTDDWKQPIGGAPARGAQSSGDIWRLVQSAGPELVDAKPRETILAVFPRSAPEGAEEDIAREYRLEIVRRLTLPGLGMRIAGYRILDATPPATVIGRLQADGRIESAQLNLAYRPRKPGDAESEVGNLEAPRVKQAAPPAGRRRASVEPRSQSRPAAAARATAPKATWAKQQRSRVRVSAADVLAGGL